MNPQIFYINRDNTLVVVLCKAVYYMMLVSVECEVQSVVERFNQQFELDTVTRRPGSLFFFGLNVTKHDNMSVSFVRDDKLNGIESCPMTRVRRRKDMDAINEGGICSFWSINC